MIVITSQWSAWSASSSNLEVLWLVVVVEEGGGWVEVGWRMEVHREDNIVCKFICIVTGVTYDTSFLFSLSKGAKERSNA